MQREELLKLLGPEAREAFDMAKRLACARGGVLSPLHILVALLENIPIDCDHPVDERVRLLQSAREELSTRYREPAERIVVPKETQEVIADAGRMAQAEGNSRVVPAQLLRAALASPTVRESFGGQMQFELQILDLFARAQETISPSHAPEPQGDTPRKVMKQPADYPARALSGSLKEFCADLADEARAASPIPFVGREREITAVLETLCRKLKNNPLLIGKPGVGKTALVAAVALRLLAGDVPARLRGRRILEVSRLGLLADAKFAGEIEERLKRLLEEVRREGDVILFFDEIHTLLNAGGAGGTGDVANLLKSSLSKGDIMCIGATTLGEYYKYIARDEALARRFSTITIEEPSPEETTLILSRSREAFESYHGVKISQEVIALIVDMADRYLHSRNFPDKAFDLLDRAAAKTTIAGLGHLTRESVTETLSETTGLPLEIMDEEPAERLDRLEEFLNLSVPGQSRAVRDVARVVRIAKLRLELRPEQPDGIFLFMGPEGVGKHEMATALAKFLYGSPQKMIEFDMSQFTEAWAISRLVGAEPGYVGYGERSGLLSKAAEDNPHSVLYFRNIDLAHPVVQQFLGEAFERGRFTDATGARISLSNMTVAMSLSRISEHTKPMQVGFSAPTDENETRPSTTPSPLRQRMAEFGLVEALAATIDEVIEFQVLDQAAIEQIIAERLEALRARLEAAQPVIIKMDPALVGFFAGRLTSERKSLAQLERLWQEDIVIPFTQLRIDRRIVGARTEVTMRVEEKTVKVEMKY